MYISLKIRNPSYWLLIIDIYIFIYFDFFSWLYRIQLKIKKIVHIFVLALSISTCHHDAMSHIKLLYTHL